jgi:hypothetical protein
VRDILRANENMSFHINYDENYFLLCVILRSIMYELNFILVRRVKDDYLISKRARKFNVLKVLGENVVSKLFVWFLKFSMFNACVDLMQ